jgi:hypothetical protein
VFRDPLRLLELELPVGWLEEPEGSRLSRLAFISWQDDAWVTVEVHPPLKTPRSETAAWRAAATAAVEAPPDAETVPLESREGLPFLYGGRSRPVRNLRR